MKIERSSWRSAGTMTLLLACALGATACANLDLGALGAPGALPIQLTPPKVTFAGATLVQSPSSRTYAAYYCPDLINAPYGTSELVCRQFFGPRPPAAAMQVAFDLHFHIANPNQVPVPLASALAAATVFPAAGNEKLGALCISLCPPDVPGCQGGPSTSACEASSRDVHSMADFVDKSLPALLISTGVAIVNGQTPTFTLPPITAASELDVTVRYAFGPEQLLAIMRDLAAQSVNQLKKGQIPNLAIPFRLEGTVFFDAGSLGRFAVGWGPTTGTWQLPVDGLVAAAPIVTSGALNAAPSSAPPPSAPAGAPPSPSGAPPSAP
jgi:hypothetical protein